MNNPIAGKICWKDFCLNLEKDTMCSFGIRLHLNKAYPEISRGVDVTFTTKWQNRAQRNTAHPNQTQDNWWKSLAQLAFLAFLGCSVRLRGIFDFLDIFCCCWQKAISSIHWGLCNCRWIEAADKRGCHSRVISVGNYLHAAITLNDINYNGSQNGWNCQPLLG